MHYKQNKNPEKAEGERERVLFFLFFVITSYSLALCDYLKIGKVLMHETFTTFA